MFVVFLNVHFQVILHSLHNELGPCSHAGLHFYKSIRQRLQMFTALDLHGLDPLKKKKSAALNLCPTAAPSGPRRHCS